MEHRQRRLPLPGLPWSRVTDKDLSVLRPKDFSEVNRLVASTVPREERGGPPDSTSGSDRTGLSAGICRATGFGLTHEIEPTSA